MLVPRYSSRMIDYPTRLRKAQARMIELGVDLMFLPYSASLHYLMGVAREEQNFGNTIYPGDWMTGAWIAADCAPILTLPRLQAAFHGTHTQHAVRVLPDAGDPLALAQAVLPAGFDVDSYVIDAQPATHQLADGDVLELGGRSLRVLHTPGHTPGHCAFWDQERGMLFSGDAAYQGAMFSCFADCDVQATVESAQCLAALCGVRLVCPGHLDSFADSGWLQQLAAGLAAAASGRVAAQRTSEFVGGREVCFDSFSIWLPLA